MGKYGYATRIATIFSTDTWIFEKHSVLINIYMNSPIFTWLIYQWPSSFASQAHCNFPYINMEKIMFLYLNTFSIIFVGLKCEFSFNKCLRRFALLIGMDI